MVGLNVQVTPGAVQDKVMLPVKLPGAAADTVNVADALPMTTVVLGLLDDTEKSASPVPDSVTL